MDYNKNIKLSTFILFVLSIVLIIFSIIVWNMNVYAGIIYLVVAAIQLIASALFFLRILKTDKLEIIGNIAVQHNWSVLSIGLAGCALFLAPFFKVDSTVLPVMAFIVCIISAIISVANITISIKKANARMVV